MRWEGQQPATRSEQGGRLQSWVNARRGGRSGVQPMGDPYRHAVSVFRCANVIASAVARATMRVYEGETRVEQGELVDILERPNPYMTGPRFAHTVALHLALNGNAWVFKDRDDDGRLRWLVPIPPGMVSPDRSGSTNPYALKGWRVASAFGGRTLPPDQIVHIPYYPDPNDPIIGLSPLGVARIAVETDHAAQEYNRSVLENSGELSGILRWVGEGTLRDEDVEELARQWHDRHGGPGNAGKTAVLGGNYEFQPTSIPLRDLQWIEGHRVALADVARAYAVPLVFLNEFEASGLSDAGLRVQERMLYDQTVIPLARLIDAALTEGVAEDVEPGRTVYFDFDGVEALQPEANAKLERAAKLQALGYPLNTINEELELGMPSVPWGDTAFVSAGLTTPEAVIALAEADIVDSMLPPVGPDATEQEPAPSDAPPSPPPSDGADAPSEDDVPPPPPPPAAEEQASATPRSPEEEERRAQLWRTRASRSNRFSRGLRRKLIRELTKQRDAVIAAVKQQGQGRALTRSLEDAADEVKPDAIAELIKAWATSAFADGYKRAHSELDVVSDEQVEFALGRKEINKIAERYFDARLGEVVQIGERIRKRVRDTLVEGWTEGESLADLIERITETFNASFARARTIARTETLIALHGGQFERYRGVPGLKIEWVVPTKDEHVRDSHMRLDGDRVEVGQEFRNGLLHPHDPAGRPEEIINCRCEYIPIIEGLSDA